MTTYVENRTAESLKDAVSQMLDTWQLSKTSRYVDLPVVLAAIGSAEQLHTSVGHQIARFKTLVQVGNVLEPVVDELSDPGAALSNRKRAIEQELAAIEEYAPYYQNPAEAVMSDRLDTAIEKRDALKGRRAVIWEKVNALVPFEQLQTEVEEVAEAMTVAITEYRALAAEADEIIEQLKADLEKVRTS